MVINIFEILVFVKFDCILFFKYIYMGKIFFLVLRLVKIGKGKS